MGRLPVVEDFVSAGLALGHIEAGSQQGDHEVGKVPLQPLDSRVLLVVSLVGWGLTCKICTIVSRKKRIQEDGDEPVRAYLSNDRMLWQRDHAKSEVTVCRCQSESNAQAASD